MGAILGWFEDVGFPAMGICFDMGDGNQGVETEGWTPKWIGIMHSRSLTPLPMINYYLLSGFLAVKHCGWHYSSRVPEGAFEGIDLDLIGFSIKGQQSRRG